MLVLQTLSKPFRHSAQLLTNFILRSFRSRIRFNDRLNSPTQNTRNSWKWHFNKAHWLQAKRKSSCRSSGLDRRQEAKDVMKPRSQMTSIPDDLSVPEMIGAAKKFKHRRLPMYDETPDTIVGVLNTRAFVA